MMADGSGMKISPEAASACSSLDAAIEQLSAGELDKPLSVDLGSGQIARFEKGDDVTAFLERLVAHRALLELAEANPGSTAPTASPLMVDSHAKALLDAVKKAR